jgi:SAM-dependent methyltransferase
MLSLIRDRFPQGGDVLDMGCGPRDQAEPFRHMGFRYVGIDYDGSAADLLADGHALPFRDGSFDVVFSFAVLEHLHTPARAIAEVARVLRPGGVYVGTVSQGEPFHASYFHFTPWGMVAMFDGFGALDLVRHWTSDDTLRALSSMGRYPRIVRLLLAVLDRVHSAAPWLAPRRMRLPRKEKEIDSLYRAGSLCFFVVKT